MDNNKIITEGQHLTFSDAMALESHNVAANSGDEVNSGSHLNVDKLNEVSDWDETSSGDEKSKLWYDTHSITHSFTHEKREIDLN